MALKQGNAPRTTFIKVAAALQAIPYSPAKLMIRSNNALIVLLDFIPAPRNQDATRLSFPSSRKARCMPMTREILTQSHVAQLVHKIQEGHAAGVVH